MSRQLLNLPTHIPWRQIAVSADMIDTRFCDKRFPSTWRSSLAIAAYEPAAGELPEAFARQRLTYLKVTCTITGYQPSREETEAGYVEYPNVPTAELDRIFSEYYGCYGVLLNVAVFPDPSTRLVYGQPVTISFAEAATPDEGVPLVVEGAQFTRPDGDAPPLTDLSDLGLEPALGPGRVIDLGLETHVQLPSAHDRVVATLVRRSDAPVSMLAYRADVEVGRVEADVALDQFQELSLDATNIDRLVFRGAQGAAYLVELRLFDASRRDLPLGDYPQVVDMAPKTRDLYQAASESGEILTASGSSVRTDKTLINTESTETGFKLGVEAPIPGVDGSKLSGQMSRTRTDTEQDRWTVATDASRERRETQGTSTQLSQMYNLLTGYHQGTNRASFLMLPRPHVLQPTDHRTFVQGLRIIEGIQEFLLIVARPSDVAGLCIEARLDTGHFPSHVDITEPPAEFEERDEVFVVKAYADDGIFSGSCTAIENDPSAQYTIEAGWVIDRQKGDPGHPGVSEIQNNSNGRADSSLKRYSYRANSDVSVLVSGEVCSSATQDARFERSYRVFTRRELPKPSTDPPTVETPFLITTRGLCSCIRSGVDGFEVVPVRIAPDVGGVMAESLASESSLRLDASVLAGAVRRGRRGPATGELMAQIRNAMTSSWRLPSRYPAGRVGFLDSDTLARAIARTLGDDGNRRVADMDGLSANVKEALGARCTVAEALAMPLAELARRAGVDLDAAAEARQQLMGRKRASKA